MPSQAAEPVLDIACLCADWCGTCRDYAATFAALQRAWPGLRWRWIDIEDEAALVGEVDVETFPTLLVAHQGEVLFAGPVLPGEAAARRLIEVHGLGLKPAPALADAAQGAAYAALARALAAA